MCMCHITGCDPYRDGNAIRRIILFMRYIAVPYIFKQSVRNQPSALFVGMGQDGYKFFSAISGDKIIRSCYTSGKSLRDNFNAFITFKMAVYIVVSLEEVNVDHHYA